MIGLRIRIWQAIGNASACVSDQFAWVATLAAGRVAALREKLRRKP